MPFKSSHVLMTLIRETATIPFTICYKFKKCNKHFLLIHTYLHKLLNRAFITSLFHFLSFILILHFLGSKKDHTNLHYTFHTKFWNTHTFLHGDLWWRFGTNDSVSGAELVKRFVCLTVAGRGMCQWRICKIFC